MNLEPHEKPAEQETTHFRIVASFILDDTFSVRIWDFQKNSHHPHKTFDRVILKPYAKFITKN